MRKTHVALALLLAATAAAAPEAAGQDRQKRAQTGMKFLSVSLVPRAAALADGVIALEGLGSASLFYNPAAMARQEQAVSFSAGITQWIAEIGYNQASIAFSPAGGRFGVFGVSALAVDYGELVGTVRNETELGYEKTGDFTPTAWAFGLGYARALTDRFSVGGHVKLVRQSLGASIMSLDAGQPVSQDNRQTTPAVDFGVLYRTGFRSLNLAMTLRNFSQEVTYESEGFQLPLTFRIGVSMDVMDVFMPDQTMHALLVTAEAERPRDFSEQIKIGGEYRFLNTFAVRAGYAYPSDEQGVSLGVGLHRALGRLQFGADYAYTEFGVFENVHRIGFQLGF